MPSAISAEIETGGTSMRGFDQRFHGSADGDGFASLEDYGIVGNQETCALISKHGCVDWLPAPYLDSASVLAAILDPEHGGTFSITPILKFQSKQRYIHNSNVLITEFSTATGEVAITDFMPPLEAGLQHRMLLRKITAKRLDTKLRVLFQPRFDYGRRKADIVRKGKKLIASGDRLSIVLSGGDLAISTGEAAGLLSLREGDVVWMVLMWGKERNPPQPAECETLLEKTVTFWTAWSDGNDRSDAVHNELYRELAIRSGLALKLLLNPATGGIAAAASLGLPESIGGLRNWDYRFAWIRDASFTAQALFHLGYVREAAEYRQWVLEILEKIEDLSGVQPLYPLHEEAQTEEGPVEILCGYRHSTPVRVGNKASEQTQLDIYGELVNTVFETTRHGDELKPEVWETVQRICDFVCDNWGKKDRGIWEVRTEPRHFVHSKLMCWVALDRGMKIARYHNFDAPLGRWETCAGEIHATILEKGFSKQLNSFVQSFGEEELDASALLIPLHRFLPPHDPRVQGTIDAVWKRLSAGNGLLHRYQAEDGLAGKEGAFIVCSYWLVNALAVSRRIEEAETVFRQMLVHVSPLGLLSEEVDPRDGRLIGNFPQALSHLGLINAALHLGIAKGYGFQGPPPQSESDGG
jgi:alpha,alpha-trehalase